MNRPELYKKTTDTLINAYIENKLFHGACHACAVGNICNNDIRWTYVISSTVPGRSTGEILAVLSKDFYANPDRRSYNNARNLVNATGYSPNELEKIEYAFESSIILTPEGYNHWTLDEHQDEGQFIGLMAVMDVLNEIHECNDDSPKERLEAAFSNRIQTQC